MDETVPRPKKRKPMAICSHCRAVFYTPLNINRGCDRRLPEGRGCVGCIRSASNPDDWAECNTCLALGEVQSEICSACDGAGWRFVGAQF